MRYVCWVTATLFALAFALTAKFTFHADSVSSGGRFDDPHRDIPCTDCHPLRADVSSGGPVNRQFRQQCEKCHDPGAANLTGIPLNFHNSRERSCSECHSFHNTEQISLANSSFLVSFENSFQRGQCYCCHGPGENIKSLSPGHRAAAAIFHSDFAVLGRLSSSQTCLICHSDASALPVGEISQYAKGAPRFKEHGSHPVGVEVIPGTGKPGNAIIDPIGHKIQLFNNRMECSSCHSLSAGHTPFRLVYPTRNELCRACHKID